MNGPWGLRFILMGSIAAAGALGATVDSRETGETLRLLQAAGVVTRVDAAGKVSLVGDEISCIHTAPSPGWAIPSGYACDLRDHESGAVGNLSGDNAKAMFGLTAHYGGTFTAWTEIGTDFEKVTAVTVGCEKAGDGYPSWRCEVTGWL